MNICNVKPTLKALLFVFVFAYSQRKWFNLSISMARNHQFRVDLEEMGFRSRSHLFLNEFETSAGRFNLLSRNHRDHPYVSDVVDTLSEQFSSMSLLHPKPRLVPTLPSSLQVISFFPLFHYSVFTFSSQVSCFCFGVSYAVFFKA